MLQRVQVTDTSQHQLFRGDCVNCFKETTNKETCLGQETRAVEICTLVWSVQMRFFWSNRCVFVRCRVGERMISACVVPTVKHGGGGWWCFTGDTVCDLFRRQGTLHQHTYHSILQRHSIPSGLRLVGLSFVFQQDNDPKHLQTV